MQIQNTSNVHSRSLQVRLDGLEAELGIVGFQKAAWQVFAETVETVAETVVTVGRQSHEVSLDHAPSLPTSLRGDTKRLSAQLEATRLLTAITANLYRSLNPQQRKRADRLLSPLLRELRNADVAAHRLAA